MAYNPLPFRDSVAQETIFTPPPSIDEVGPPEIPREDIRFDKEKDLLGEGAFGKVYKGTVCGKPVAIKVPIKQNLKPEELQAFRHEVALMRKIFHPNVVLFLGACTSQGNIMIITELMETDVEKLIHETKTPLSVLDKLKLLKEAALGMSWLHKIVSIIHRDLKPANLLIDSKRNVKVTDFGFSQLYDKRDMKDKLGPKGTALYMAPEVMKQEKFNQKADVYSFGLIMHEVMTQKELFPEYEEWDEFFNAIVVKGIRPPIPKDMLPSLAHLMKRCWHEKAEQRPSFQEIIFRMDEIIVDCYLSGEGKLHLEEGRKFWKDNFLVPTQTLKEEVEWKEFVSVLSRDLKMSLGSFEPLKAILTSPSEKIGKQHEKVVTLERFSYVLQWFGLFFVPSVAPSILNEMKTLLASEWFHGDITKDIADKRLFKRDVGCFLIRLSTTSPTHPFTLSKVSDNTVAHKRIGHLPGKGFVIAVRQKNGSVADQEFKNLIELVQCKGLGLGTPCPPSVLNWNPYDERN